MFSTKDDMAYLVLEEVTSKHSAKNKCEDGEDLQKPHIKVQGDGASLNKRGQDYRLHELEQQLEIAETRCGTLKQQLDYMKSLYQGVHKAPLHEEKRKKDRIKRKSRSRDKCIRLSAESSLEKKVSESSLKKAVNKMPSSSSSSAKTSPRYFPTASKLEKGHNVTQRNNIITDLTKQDKSVSRGDEISEELAYELPIRDCSARPASISAYSRPSSAVQGGDSLAAPQYMVVDGNLSEQNDKLDSPASAVQDSTSSAVQVIHDILSGITDSVNRISQLNVYINDGGKESHAVVSQSELSTQNKLCQDQYQLSIDHKDDKNVDMATNTEIEDMSASINTSVETDRQFNFNSCSDSNVEQIYDKNFNRIEGNVNFTRRHNKQRAGKRDVPPKLLENFITDSIESIRGNKRKGKSHAKQTEKKPKGLSPHFPLNSNKVKSRIAEDVISVTTKIKRKRNPKLKTCNSRSTIGCRPDQQDLVHNKLEGRGVENDPSYTHVPIPYQVWHSDNVVELYHNSSLCVDMSASEENFTRYSHTSKSTLKSIKKYSQREECKQQKRCSQKHDNYNIEELGDIPCRISDDSDNEMMTAERIMQKVIEPIPNEEHLNRTFDTPCLESQNPMLNVVMPPINIDNRDAANPEEEVYTSNLKKNFQLPTVSSKMKQVDRSYFQRFNFRNIPFVAGTSTSPSHNLGLNIQQVLSIIKMRQPIAGFSPTGIINRHLSGESQHPCMTPMSRPCSRAAGHKPFCPAMLPEELPEIPEKDGGGGETNFVSDIGPLSQPFGGQYPNTRPATALPFFQERIDHNFNSGKEYKAEDAWTVEQNESENKGTRSNLRCTCFPTRRCVNYQKILNQYLENGEKVSFLRTTPPECQIPYKHQALRPHYSTMSRTQRGNRMMVQSVLSGQSLDEKRIIELSAMKDAQRKILNDDNMSCDTKNKVPNFFVDIQGRARSLKEVLTNLHEDFSRLSSKYDELQAGVTQDTVDETEAVKQLEAMESELQSKEDEITVVMALYKEVMSLKEQVRALRERTSLANFSPQPVAQIRKRRILVREPTAAVRLTKLLRTIQQFQDKLKHD